MLKHYDTKYKAQIFKKNCITSISELIAFEEHNQYMPEEDIYDKLERILVKDVKRQQ